jgi:hypothetical protein
VYVIHTKKIFRGNKVVVGDMREVAVCYQHGHSATGTTGGDLIEQSSAAARTHGDTVW